METIGRRIAAARHRLGLSQQAVAEPLHVTRQAVSGWEHDKTQPDADTLLALAALLGCSVGTLLGEAPLDPPRSPRWNKRRLLCSGLLFCLLLLLQLFLFPGLQAEAQKSYRLLPSLLWAFFVPPLLCCAGSLLLLELAIGLLGAPRLSSRLRRCLFVAGGGALVCYPLLLLCQLLGVCPQPLALGLYWMIRHPLFFAFCTAALRLGKTERERAH